MELSPIISCQDSSTSRTSSDSFPPSEVTFDVLMARVTVREIRLLGPLLLTAMQITKYWPLLNPPVAGSVG